MVYWGVFETLDQQKPSAVGYREKMKTGLILQGRRACGEVYAGNKGNGAGEGNRTLVVSLGSFCSTIELHPHSFNAVFIGQNPRIWQAYSRVIP